MTALFRTVLVLVCVRCVGGCVSDGSAVPAAVVTSQRATAIPVQRANDAVVVGKSTRHEVQAALGETLAIRFDSGFEVWVYRLADAPRKSEVTHIFSSSGSTGAEFVILFAPSGVVTKTRIRG